MPNSLSHRAASGSSLGVSPVLPPTAVCLSDSINPVLFVPWWFFFLDVKWESKIRLVPSQYSKEMLINILMLPRLMNGKHELMFGAYGNAMGALR